MSKCFRSRTLSLKPTVHANVVVGGSPLPGTISRQSRIGQCILVLEGCGRKVDVSFDGLVVIGLGDYLIVEGCCCVRHC